MYVVADSLLNTNRVRINTLTLTNRLPTMHGVREFVDAGGLISYGPNIPDMYRRAADFVDKILRGTRPADIPGAATALRAHHQPDYRKGNVSPISRKYPRTRRCRD